MTACSFIYKCKQRENMKKHPYFHFELKRQAKNCQGGVIIDFSHISPRTVVENISFLIKTYFFRCR